MSTHKQWAEIMPHTTLSKERQTVRCATKVQGLLQAYVDSEGHIKPLQPRDEALETIYNPNLWQQSVTLFFIRLETLYFYVANQTSFICVTPHV